MNYTRIFSSLDLSFKDKLNLSTEASKHLKQVLRKKKGSIIQLFDGKGFSCLAEIKSFQGKKIEVELIEKKIFKPRQGIDIFLGLSLVKPEPFRFSIQKATELGVVSISPLDSERTVVNLNENSKISRIKRWVNITIGACQQCGEDWLPEIKKIQALENWSKTNEAKHKIVLYPKAKTKITDLKFNKSVTVAVGPVGDFTKEEITLLEKNNFIAVSLGKRILRTETAVVSSLSAIRTMCREF